MSLMVWLTTIRDKASSYVTSLTKIPKRLSSLTEAGIASGTYPSGIFTLTVSASIPPDLITNKVSATMHIYPTGGHGFGWGDNYIYKSEWSAELERWFNTVVLK